MAHGVYLQVLEGTTQATNFSFGKVYYDTISCIITPIFFLQGVQHVLKDFAYNIALRIGHRLFLHGCLRLSKLALAMDVDSVRGGW